MGFVSPDVVSTESRHVYGMVMAMIDADAPSLPGYMDGYLLCYQSAVGDSDVGGQVGDFHDWIFQHRVDAWGAWAADVAGMSAASTRALEEALANVNSDEQDLSIARRRVAAAWEQGIALKQAWPGLRFPTSRIPWRYFDEDC